MNPMVPVKQTAVPVSREAATISFSLTRFVSTPMVCAASSPKVIMSICLENRHRYSVPGIRTAARIPRLLPAAAGKASHLPQKKLLHVILFQHADQSDQGVHEQGKNHTGQNDGLILKSPVHPRCECDHSEHRSQTEYKPRQRQGQKARNRKQESAHNHQRSTKGSAG